MDKPSIHKWKLLEQELVGDYSIFDVVVRKFEHQPRNTTGDFFVIRPKNWVMAIAVTPEKKCVMVRQFRFGSKDFSLEFPGGCMDEDEDPIEAGVRELAEETGYRGDARYLSWCYPNPAIQDNKCHFIFVENARQVEPLNWDEHEEINIELYEIDQIEAFARTGEMTHSMAMAALVHAKPWFDKI